MRTNAVPLDRLEARVGDAARLLKLLANEARLLILCRLAGEREMQAGALVDAVGLAQSAVSQHLARLREDGLVVTRRDGQIIYYRVVDKDALRILALLKDIFCPQV